MRSSIVVTHAVAVLTEAWLAHPSAIGREPKALVTGCFLLSPCNAAARTEVL